MLADGRTIVHKVLSRLPGEDAAAATIRGIKEISGHLPPGTALDETRVGTTVATNALLTRSGSPLLLITTEGHADALSIGYQARPDIFALEITKPEPLYSEVATVDCRVDKNGNVLKPFSEASKEALKERLADFKLRHPDAAIAVNLLHALAYPEHEKEIGALAASCGYGQVSLSHQVNPQIKLIGRGDTTCVDAYLTPVLRDYSASVSRSLDGATRLSFMKSDGGLSSASAFSGKDALLSGPAGGVVGAAIFAGKHWGGPITGFDMGGTSTDVCYFEGDFLRTFESTICGVRVRAPMMDVHTVASGGGSILTYESGRLQVGPQSAGASPGPACYGHGGPLTVTDANLYLGRVAVSTFPSSFGRDLKQPLDLSACQRLFAELGSAVAERSESSGYSDLARLADGFITVAIEKMSRALLRVTSERGHDVTKAALVAFGGAGGQHACRLAERVGIETILISPLAGVLSAHGIGLSRRSATRVASHRKALTADLKDIEKMAEALEQSARQELDAKLVTVSLFLRSPGSDSTIQVGFPAQGQDRYASIIEEYENKHRRLFGFITDALCERDLLVEDIMVEASEAAVEDLGVEAKLDFVNKPQTRLPPQRLYAAGAWHDVTPLTRASLVSGLIIAGPALIADCTATTIVEPGWQAEVLADGTLRLTRTGEKSGTRPALRQDEAVAADPVTLELYNNIFMAVAEEMGATLRQTSHSVNIKERLDFSCAVFDEKGRLIANAPHMPVHLGSMGEAVVSLIAARGESLQAGDVYLSNNPYNGGTHLPDITAISPVHLEGEIMFYVASRGHHADIGGITPGSMPPTSRHIAQEGALLDNELIMRAGVLDAALIESLFTDPSKNPHPARNLSQTLADLKAQIAANRKGIEALTRLVRQRGREEVLAYMTFIRINAREAVEEILDDLQDGSAESRMDDGSIIRVKIAIDRSKKKATIDFGGTSALRDNNFNAPKAVVRAAVLYVFRTLTRRDIPLNDGCAEPLDLIIEEGSMLAPVYPHAVVAGNVETSQVIVDTLYRALGVMAASQGTMNNFTFGNDRYQYYETICGGSGAGATFAGCDAVQTHMTNTRLTDPEILESRFPVILEEFSIRKGSGGSGKNRGGDGVIRRLKFLEPMQASILSNHRSNAPLGLSGGGDAKLGATRIIRQDESVETLAFRDSAEMAAGDTIIIETPGGGGFGV